MSDPYCVHCEKPFLLAPWGMQPDCGCVGAGGRPPQLAAAYRCSGGASERQAHPGPGPGPSPERRQQYGRHVDELSGMSAALFTVSEVCFLSRLDPAVVCDAVIDRVAEIHRRVTGVGP